MHQHHFLSPSLRSTLIAWLLAALATAQVQVPPLGLPSLQPPPAGLAACFAPGTNPAYVQLVQAAFPNSSLAPLPEFRTGDRWSAPAGSGRTLRYSFPPDGLAISSSAGSNVMRQVWNARFGSEPAWRSLFRSALDTWQDATDLVFVEVGDDGAAWGTAGSGSRGDIRFVTGTIDGPGQILALAAFPGNGGDIVIDRTDVPGMGDAQLRNVITHEVGHSIGLAHVCPVAGTKLMEPFLTGLTGPQLDDIRGGQELYGDRFEPNDSAATGVSLTSLGARPGPALVVRNLGLRDSGDEDWFSLELCPQDNVTVTATPVGTDYLESAQTQACNTGAVIHAASLLDLALEFAPPGGFGSIVDSAGLGGAETHNLTGYAGHLDFRVFSRVASAQRGQVYQLTVAITRANASVLFVDDSANGSNNGTSWSNAFRLLSQALAAATGGCGGVAEIWVAAGTYKPTGGFIGSTAPDLSISFVVPDGVRVFGGFAGNETQLDQRDPVANPTVLSGSYPHPIISGVSARNVVKMSNVGSGTILDGLIIQRGHAFGPSPNGGGVLLNGSSPVFRRCQIQGVADGLGGAVASLGNGRPTFEDCTLLGGDGVSSAAQGGALSLANGGTLLRCTIRDSIATSGGAISLASGDLLVADCAFHDNQAWDPGSLGGRGGAISASGATGSVRVSNSQFADNLGADGGAIHVRSVALEVRDCRFERNQATRSGGAIHAEGVSALLSGLVVVGNRAATGGGATIQPLTTDVVACTVAGNAATTGVGGLLVGGTGTLRNSILWGNSVGGVSTGPGIQLAFAGTAGRPSVGYCCVDGYASAPGEVGNLAVDPQLVDVAGGDLHLRDASPCIDAGLSTAANQPTLDLDGQPRRLCGAVDVGVDEFGESVVRFVGTSCAGDIDVEGVPRLGSAYQIKGWSPGGFAFLYVGLSATVWPGVGSLPIGLGVLGGAGCALYSAPEFLLHSGLVSTSAAAPTSISLTVPNDAAFVCVHLFHEWIFWDALSPQAPLSTSRSAEVRIGF